MTGIRDPLPEHELTLKTRDFDRVCHLSLALFRFSSDIGTV